MLNYHKLNQYITNVIEQAGDSINYKGRTPRYWTMLINDDLLFHMESVSEKDRDEIVKRTLFRLDRNIPRHFQLHFYAPGLHGYRDAYGDKYDFVPSEMDWEWTKALTEVKIFNQRYILCSKFDVVLPEDMSTEMMNDMIETGIGKDGIVTFPQVYNAYIKLWHETPIGIWKTYMEHGSLKDLNTSIFIESTIQDDYNEKGCGYYSVCKYASLKCKTTDACYRPTIMMKDGIATSTWRKFKQEQMEEELEQFKSMK